MSRGGVRAGRAEILLRIRDQTRQGLRNANRSLNTFAARVARIGAGLGGGGLGIAGLFTPAVKEFARVEQLLGRFDSVLGDLSGSASKFSDNLAGSINQSGLAIRDALAQFQGFAQGQGFSPDFALSLSTELTAAKEDLIAFDDSISNSQEAITRLQSVFTGETEPARRFFADFRKEALDTDGALSEFGSGFNKRQIETLARVRELRRAFGQGGITGQASREVNTLAAQMRGFRAALVDTTAAIGGQVGPQIAGLLSGFTSATRSIQEFAGANPGLVQAAAASGVVLIALGGAASALAVSLFLVGGAVGGITTIASALSGLAVPAATIAIVGAGIFALIQNIETLRNAVGGLLAPVTDTFQEIRQQVQTALAGISDALASGEIGLAGKIAGAGLEIAFEQTFGRIRNGYRDLVDTIAIGLVDILPDGLFGASRASITKTLAGDIENRDGAQQERLAALRDELAALRESAAIANEKAKAEQSAANSANTAQSIEETRQQQQRIQGAARAAGTFSGLTAAQQFGPQVDQLKKILGAEKKQTIVMERVAKAIETLPQWRYA